jgi:hypothetical protein
LQYIIMHQQRRFHDGRVHEQSGIQS